MKKKQKKNCYTIVKNQSMEVGALATSLLKIKAMCNGVKGKEIVGTYSYVVVWNTNSISIYCITSCQGCDLYLC